MPEPGNTDKKFRRHMRALNVDTSGLGSPAPNRARDAIPGSSKVIRDPAPSGAGIASPLTETERLFYDPVVLQTTDSLFAFEIKPVKTIKMRDPNNAEVVFEYDNPFD